MNSIGKLGVLLQGIFGGDVRVIREVRDLNGAVVLHWAPVPAPGIPPLGAPPALVVQPDYRTMRWEAPAFGFRAGSFSIRDLAEADPSKLENLDVRTRAIASDLKRRAMVAGLLNRTSAIALAVALERSELAPDAVAALISTAYEMDYWEARKYATDAWRYQRQDGPLALRRPYSAREAENAAQVAGDADFLAEVVAAGGRDSDGEIWLPVLANPRAAPLIRGRTP